MCMDVRTVIRCIYRTRDLIGFNITFSIAVVQNREELRTCTIENKVEEPGKGA